MVFGIQEHPEYYQDFYDALLSKKFIVDKFVNEIELVREWNKKLIEDEIERVLSDLEKEVFQSYLDGKSYQEIACDLDVQAKSIDNALQRVKRKLEKCLASKEQK